MSFSSSPSLSDVVAIMSLGLATRAARAAQIASDVAKLDELPAWEESALRDAELANLASVARAAQIASDVAKLDELPAWEESAERDARRLAQFLDFEDDFEDDSHNYDPNEGDWSDCGSSIHSDDSDGSDYDEYLEALGGQARQAKQVEQVYQAEYDILVMCSNCDQNPISNKSCTCFFRTVPAHFVLGI